MNPRVNIISQSRNVTTYTGGTEHARMVVMAQIDRHANSNVRRPVSGAGDICAASIKHWVRSANPAHFLWAEGDIDVVLSVAGEFPLTHFHVSCQSNQPKKVESSCANPS